MNASDLNYLARDYHVCVDWGEGLKKTTTQIMYVEEFQITPTGK